MYSFSRRLWSLLLAFSLYPYTQADGHWESGKLNHFVTRPELKAPKWDVTIYDQDQYSDGFWFVASKPSMEREIGSGKGWYGPMIYDKEGELVWSGSDQFDTSNIMDFRLSNVRGEQLLTMIDRDRSAAILFDNEYELRDMISMVEDINGGTGPNGHELNFVDNGTSVVYLYNEPREATEEDKRGVGFSGSCKVQYNRFRELDATNNWEHIFEFDSRGTIHLNESTGAHDDNQGEVCDTWDFIHPNSVDKTTDGDYLLSGRHTDTIYRISKEDGHIVWRFGGKQSDFELGPGVKFSRQHNIRFRGQNKTHTIVSMLDNARGQDGKAATHGNSRGLLLALLTEETPMRAEVVLEINHPKGEYNDRRGNLQVLENGNIFMGWSESAFQSEHAPDGKLLMEAQFGMDWVGSYRNYKFPFVGRPQTKPDVWASAYLYDEIGNKDEVTWVYVSWNGDTQVVDWNLYGQLPGSEKMELLDTQSRTGFETFFEYRGYAKSVRLRGVDKDGNEIGDSGKVKTIPHPTTPVGDVNDMNDNEIWVQEERYATPVFCKVKKCKSNGVFGNPPIIFVLGCISSAGALVLGWLGILPLARLARQRVSGKRSEATRYEKVAGDDFDQRPSLTLDDVPPYTSRDRSPTRSPNKHLLPGE